MGAAQRRLVATAGSTSTPPGLAAATIAAAGTQTRLARATEAVAGSQTTVKATSDAVRRSTENLSRSIKVAEEDTARFARGTVAATLASTGFFRAVSFASGAFLVGATIGASLAAAVDEFRNTVIVGAQTLALIKATGGAARVSAKQVNELAKSQRDLTGVSAPEIQAMENVLLTFKEIRNVGSGMNEVFTRAVKDTQDIATVMRSDLVSTAKQVGKALQDPAIGMTALRRAGISFTQGQRALVKSLVQTGQLLRAQKVVLAGIEQQIGGTARAVGQTLPGKLAIMRERTKEALGEFVDRFTKAKTVTEGFTQTLGGLGEAIRIVRAALAPLLGALVLTVQELVKLGAIKPLVEALTLLATALIGIKVASLAASAAQGIYTRAVAAATVATTAEGVAAEGAATRLSLSAFALNALRSPLGIAIGITAVAIGFKKLVDAGKDAPGTLGGAKRALDGLADSIQRLDALQTGAAAAAEKVSLARADQIAAVRGVRAARAALARSTAPEGSLLRRGLEDNLRAARGRLQDANRKLGAAEDALTQKQSDEAAQQQKNAAAAQQTNESLQRQITLIRTLSKLSLGGSPLGQLQRDFQRQGLPVPGSVSKDLSGIAVGKAGDQLDRAVKKAKKIFEDLAKDSNKTKATVGAVFSAIVDTFGVLPSKHQIDVTVAMAAQSKSTLAILKALGLNVEGVPGVPQAQVQTQARISAQADAILQEQIKAAQAQVKLEEKRLGALTKVKRKREEELATIKQTVAADKDALQSARDALDSAIRSLQDARRSYRDAVTTLRDSIVQAHTAIAQAITDSRNAVTQAVQSAKDNLASLGQALAGTLDSFAQAGGRLGGAGGGALGARFRQLRDQIIGGQGGPETIRAAQQAAFQLQQKAPKTADLQRKFADLSFDLSTGAIKNMREFNRRLQAIISNLDPQKLKATLGSAAAGEFLSNLRLFRQQAAAILAGPLRQGGPGQGQVISPAEALRQGAKSIHDARVQAAKDIAGAERSVGDAARGIKDAERQVQRAHEDLSKAIDKLRRDQVRETKANTRATEANTRAARQLTRVLDAKAKLDPSVKRKDKGSDGASHDAARVTQKGAVAP